MSMTISLSNLKKIPKDVDRSKLDSVNVQEMQCLAGIKSNIQEQLDSKAGYDSLIEKQVRKLKLSNLLGV